MTTVSSEQDFFLQPLLRTILMAGVRVESPVLERPMLVPSLLYSAQSFDYRVLQLLFLQFSLIFISDHSVTHMTIKL